MRVDATYAAATFYSLQAMKVLLFGAEYGKHSAEKLSEDIEIYENTFINKLSTMLFDYSTLVVFGEMRHASDQCEAYVKDVPQGGARSDNYEAAKQYNPCSILDVGVLQFKKKWNHSFGGEKWMMIAKIARQIKTMNPVIYCDTCFSLSHNTSPYLNKYEANIFSISSISAYKSLLDTKCYGNPIATLKSNIQKINYNVSKFIQRLVNLQYANITLDFHTFTTADTFEEAIFNYHSIDWGTKILKPVFYTSGDASIEDERREDDRERMCA